MCLNIRATQTYAPPTRGPKDQNKQFKPFFKPLNPNMTPGTTHVNG